VQALNQVEQRKVKRGEVRAPKAKDVQPAALKDKGFPLFRAHINYQSGMEFGRNTHNFFVF
jgi:hypothetical protein